MSDIVKFTMDGAEVTAKSGQTILEAATAAGIYIPQLCYLKGLMPHASCRICTVLVNGRPQSACTQPVAEGAVVESNTPLIQEHRRQIVEMLFVEGNHYCMFCERSGNCELQAIAYRLGITAPRFPYLFPKREVDASHPDVMIDRNRCILCGRCVSASKEKDGKNVFGFVNRAAGKRLAVNSDNKLADTDLARTDKAAEVCPVGCIIKKRVGFAVPIGSRSYDHLPIGTDVETRKSVSKG